MDLNFDLSIENYIKEYLNREMQESAMDINVKSKDGYVTLYGFVDTLSEKSNAEELANRIEGVKSVENCLTVSTDGTFLDKEIETEVLKKLRCKTVLNPITPKINKGVAVLEGTVPTLKIKNLAIHQTSKAMGVKDIVSHICIDSVGKIDDATITNMVHEELATQRIDRSDIGVDVFNGSVKLTGFVKSCSDMETAMEITEGVEGVRNVKNYLQIR